MEKITVTKNLLIQMLSEAYNAGWYGQLGEKNGAVTNIIQKHIPSKASTSSNGETLEVFSDKHSAYFSITPGHSTKSTLSKYGNPGNPPKKAPKPVAPQPVVPLPEPPSEYTWIEHPVPLTPIINTPESDFISELMDDDL